MAEPEFSINEVKNMNYGNFVDRDSIVTPFFPQVQTLIGPVQKWIYLPYENLIALGVGRLPLSLYPSASARA